LRGLGSAPEGEFEEAVEDEADPSEDEQSPVEAEGLMLRGGWKMRHEDEKVEQAAKEDGDELAKEAGEHFRVQFQVLNFQFQDKANATTEWRG